MPYPYYTGPVTPVGVQPPTSNTRWDELMSNITSLLPDGTGSVLIDGGGAQSGIVADRLAATLNANNRPCLRPAGTGLEQHTAIEQATALEQHTADDRESRIPVATITMAAGAGWCRAKPWDVVIWLRTPPVSQRLRSDGEAGADIVIDLHDPAWPVIRSVAAPLANRGPWYITETRAFFSPRAATWDTKFGDDLPAYASAIAEAGVPADGVVVDVGCGTGRALPALRRAVGPHGAVLAIDLTPEMLHQAHAQGRADSATLILADARRLPLATASVDAVFAAGLIMHLPDTAAGLGQLARITRADGLLIVFHPAGRAAPAPRHGRTIQPDDPLSQPTLRRSAQAAGWRLALYDDAEHRFLAIATRLS
jgi:SAM-dependent methyltransferase